MAEIGKKHNQNQPTTKNPQTKSKPPTQSVGGRRRRRGRKENKAYKACLVQQREELCFVREGKKKEISKPTKSSALSVS